jgi:hypothetical protein
MQMVKHANSQARRRKDMARHDEMSVKHNAQARTGYHAQTPRGTRAQQTFFSSSPPRVAMLDEVNAA